MRKRARELDNTASALPLTLPALWRSRVDERGDALLHVCDDERITYAEADARSARLAKGLIAAGIGKGAHVALLYPNSPDFIVGLLAAARIGAVAVPISTLSSAEELGWLLANADAACLLAARGYRSQDFAAMLPAAVPGLDLKAAPPLRLQAAPWLRHVWFSGPAPEGEAPGWSIADLEALGGTIGDAMLAAAEARVSPGDRLVIVHTSGSTSRPKGVIHAHGTLIRHLANINRVRDLRADDVLFATSPWFWIAGFGFGLIGTLVAGARIVCSNAAEPSRVLDFIERERPTMSNGYAPGMIRYAQDPSFAARDFSFMRRGNLHPIMPPDVRPADMDLRHNIYGMTEVGSALTMSADETDQPEHRRGSLGQLLPGFEARIVDPETGEDCPAGEVGELWLRGPLMMEGYYGRPRCEVFAPDGWWRSGDMCRIDADGFFYIAGRLGNMIKTAGANVSPGEVEAVMRALTGAAQCHVIGLPDPARGEVVAGVVVGDAPFEEAALREQLAGKLSRYKVPRRIFRLAETELPMLSSGKLDLPALKALVRRTLAALTRHHSNSARSPSRRGFMLWVRGISATIA